MKTLVLLALLFAIPPGYAYADFQWGSQTYNSAGQTLIVNSLGDQPILSTLNTTMANGVASQSLGANDFIEENGVKNTLAIDGYSVAYDANPSAVNSFGVYNQPLPNVPLTKLTFSGLDGDPRTNQSVYVLTSEYNALSSQGQAASINALSDGLLFTNAQVNVNTANIAVNTQNIAALNTGLSNETQARVVGDNALQGQINATNGNVQALDNRVANLERLKVMPEADIRIYDAKHVSAMVYDAYDATNGRNFAVGIKVMLKLGKSYEETKIEEQQKELDKLKELLYTYGVH